jgi:1-acyl-sn-glycerol-3-phosphate acyltransferase
MSQRSDFSSLHLPALLPARVRGLLQTALATPVVLAHTLFSGPAAVALAPLGPRGQEPLIKSWTRTVLYICGVDLVVEGRELLDPAARYVFMSNHQSHLDVPCVSTALPVPVRYVAKRSLFKVPVFGPALKAIGTVDIDRRDRADSLKKLHEATHGIGRTCSLHFFAEGTRSPDGKLQPFKKGGVAMAVGLQVPLVPVAISGSRQVYPKGAVLLRPGRVTVRIGEPIAVGPDSPDERHRLLREVRAAVARMLISLGEPVDPGDAQVGVGVGGQEVARGS